MEGKGNLPSSKVAKIDQEIFEWHNNIRENPKLLVSDLQEMVEQFDGKLLKRPGKVTLKTKEGAEAVNEAI